MRLTVLGSGTVSPSATRTSASYWVESGGVRLLIDCGAGTLHRMATFGVDWFGTTHIALSHFHADHWGELPAFLFAQRWGADTPRTGKLSLFGPRGLKPRIQALAQAFGQWILSPGFPIEIVEIEPLERHELGPGTFLECHRTRHTDESVAYSITDNDGRMVYTGDTGPSDDLAIWARGCDLLLSECSLPDDRAIDTHLTPAQAGRLARTADAARLVLTHFYPPVEAVDPVARAAAEFEREVIAASDGDIFVIDGKR